MSSLEVRTLLFQAGKLGDSPNENHFCVPTSGHQNLHEHVFLRLDQELLDIKSSMKADYLKLYSENDALATKI